MVTLPLSCTSWGTKISIKMKRHESFPFKLDNESNLIIDRWRDDFYVDRCGEIGMVLDVGWLNFIGELLHIHNGKDMFLKGVSNGILEAISDEITSYKRQAVWATNFLLMHRKQTISLCDGRLQHTDGT